MKTVVNSPHFKAWSEFFGLIARDEDLQYPSNIYGFENISEQYRDRHEGQTLDRGACFGFVESGLVMIRSGRVVWRLHAGQYFSTPRGCFLDLQDMTRIMVVERIGYFGINQAGGPIESKGRLRYIDRCSDTLLVPPQVKGEPCLNHLHFPGSIDQTQHTHPSSRIGMVSSGHGWCVTPAGKTKLVPGLLFHIPKDGIHKFATDEDSEMDVIAFHPDSDFGPTHQDHPMVNRTLVDGSKIDNTVGRHVEAEIVSGVLQ